MSRRHHKKQRFKLRSFYLWHRYMGIQAAIFVLLIAITGLLLNHTEALKFDSRHVQSEWILDWYGVKAPEEIRSYIAGGHHITLMGEDLYLDTEEIKKNSYQLTGVLFVNDMFVIAVNDSILLLTQDGELIDYLRNGDGVPSGIWKIGMDVTGSIIVQTDYEQYQPDADFLHWQRRNNDSSAIQWMSSSPVSPEFKGALQRHFRGEALPVERILLDMHSGRFFGRFGPWIFDAAAILLILLSLSGSWIWLKHKR